MTAIDPNKVKRVAHILVDTDRSLNSAAIEVFGRWPAPIVMEELEARLETDEMVVQCPECSRWVPSTRLAPETGACQYCMYPSTQLCDGNLTTTCTDNYIWMEFKSKAGVLIRTLVVDYEKNLVQREVPDVLTLEPFMAFTDLFPHIKWLQTGEN